MRVDERDTSLAPVPGAARREPLGILAGGGPLPIEVADAGARGGRPIHIVALDGFAGEEVARYPHERVSIGQLGRMIASFKQAGASEIVIAGAIQRPNLGALRIDWGFVRNLPTVLALTRGGDDSVLRRVVRFFEGHGFTVIGASDVVPELLSPLGSIARTKPSADHDRAIARAAALVAALGRFDIGQGVVATADDVVAIEGVRGTDAMLRDLGPGGLSAALGRGGVLVKLAKPGQEMRIDLPTIGPETVRGAAAAGLAGIAVGAAGAIVLGRDRVAELADSTGLFVVGIPPKPAVPEAPPERAGQDSGLLEIVARRAPTPGERRDIGIGRQVLDVLRAHGAGKAAFVSREHVLAICGKLDLPAFISAHARTRTWGRRALGRRRGVVVIDGAATVDGKAETILDVALFSAAKDTSIAGIVVLAPLSEAKARDDIVAWANEAGVFLMCRTDRP